MKKRSEKKSKRTNILAYVLLAAAILAPIFYFFAVYFLKFRPMIESTARKDITEFISFRPEIGNEPYLGDINATITITVYSGFGCAACKKYYNTTFQYLKENYISTGKAKYYHKFYMTEQDILSKSGEYNLSRFLHCLKNENPEEFFEKYESWFSLDEEDTERLVSEYSIAKTFSGCYASISKSIESEYKDNALFGILAQPTLFIGIGGHDNTLLTGNPSADILRRSIRQKEIALGMP